MTVQPHPRVVVDDDDLQRARIKLARSLGVLSNATRLAILEALHGKPAFAPDLARTFGLTRQSVKRHLDLLVEEGLVESRAGRRGTFAAAEYVASVRGLRDLRRQIDALLLGRPIPPA